MSTSQLSKRRDKKRKSKPKGWRTASTSDIHELYQLSVQEPESECDLIDQAWTERRGRVAHHIREDFCGTALASMEWVKRRKENTAVCLDIDEDVLAWGREQIEANLKPKQQARIQLVAEDVLNAQTDKVDSVLAMNFSYYLLKKRKDLIAYFKTVRTALVDDGLFLLDAYGGSEAFDEIEEPRNLDGFTYVWEQAKYDPITGHATNHIHFRFPDGSEIERAFTYHWRLWTLPEIQEMLLEAGFSDVVVYWEGTDEDGDGNGEWTVATEGEACEGWIAYIVAER